MNQQTYFFKPLASIDETPANGHSFSIDSHL